MQVDVELINAISHLVANLNDKVIICLVVILALYLLIKAVIDNKNKKHYFDVMVREKIGRLNVWLMKIGVIERYIYLK